MKLNLEKKYILWGFTCFFVFVSCLCFYYLMFHGGNLIDGIRSVVKTAMPIIEGLLIAYLITPIMNYMESKIIIPFFQAINIKITPKNKGKIRAVSIVVTFTIVIVFIYNILYLVIPQTIASVQSIINQLPAYKTNLQNFVNKLTENDPTLQQATNNLINTGTVQLYSFYEKYLTFDGISDLVNSKLFQSMLMNIVSFLLGIWHFIIGFVISIYVLFSKETFASQGKKIAYAFFTETNANRIISDFRFINNTFGGFITGKLVDSLIIGILCFIGTSIMKMPYAILVSVIIGITNVIPFFGPYFGAVPCALLIFVEDPVKCIYFLIFLLILQQFDGNILGPKILGNSTGLPSFWIIFSITLFGGIWGVAGMFFGVPIFAVIYTSFKRMINQLLKERKLPEDTTKYKPVKKIKHSQFIDLPKEETTAISYLLRQEELAAGLDNDIVKDGSAVEGNEIEEENTSSILAFINGITSMLKNAAKNETQEIDTEKELPKEKKEEMNEDKSKDSK
ncbi:MAG: AI-2E family transporter [Lachnospiraceae bacterium]|nr:AI-2E family transporter [Lachnospiraceae bacterium]